MSVASGDRRFARRGSEPGCLLVCRVDHVAVQRLYGGKHQLETLKILKLAPAGEPREDVVGAVEQPLLAQVGDQAGKIVPPALHIEVLALGDVVNTHVQFSAARHAAGDLFAQEEVCMPAQRLCGADRVMVRDGDEIHAKPLEALVDGFWRL